MLATLARRFLPSSRLDDTELCQALEHLEREGVAGDIVVCGHGGDVIAGAARVLARLGSTCRQLYLFEGELSLAARSQLRALVGRLGYPPEKLILPGSLEATPLTLPCHIALLMSGSAAPRAMNRTRQILASRLVRGAIDRLSPAGARAAPTPPVPPPAE